MPATPAWPPRSLPRLFVPPPLSEGVLVTLDGAQANYLGNVLRLGAGGEVLLFDGVNGEWHATVVEAGKRKMSLGVGQQTKVHPKHVRRLSVAVRRHGAFAFAGRTAS